MRARSPRRPPSDLRRPLAGRRPVPLTEPCHWQGGWWATMSAEQFADTVAGCGDGDLLTWSALPGVQVGEVYLLVTTAPDRRLRAWGWVVGAPDGDEAQGWRVTVRFGGHLDEPLGLKALRSDPVLSVWTPLARVTAGRLEGIPPLVWQVMREIVGRQVPGARTGPDERDEGPVPASPSRRPERRPDAALPPAWPWDGLGRGRFFEELVRRVLLPQGFTLVTLQPARDEDGIDVVAHRPEIRWTRWVAQLDVTGEVVEAAAVHEVRQGRQAHGAQAALLIATGPVSDAARAVAVEMQVTIWDAAWLRSAWLRAADGATAGESGLETASPPLRPQAIAI